MSIPKVWEKIKGWLEKDEVTHGLMVFTVILVGLAGFGLGKLSSHAESPVYIEYAKETGDEQESASSDTHSGQIVASKNGTKFYLPSCRGVGNIREENKIYFQTEEEAVAAGYTKASGCK